MRFPYLPTTRRSFLAALGAAALARGASTAAPIRALTKGPKFHWFGYYDKWQFDSTSRYVLGMQVDFEHRSPRPDDVIRIGMIDTADGDRWTELGTSSAWGWQQGCMLQWVPGSASQVIWNDRQDGQFVSRLMDVKTGKSRTLPQSVYALSQDSKWAVSTDFRRLNDTRPGYGYAGIADPNAAVLAPEDVGIWKMDLSSGKSELIFSVAQAAAIANPHNDTNGLKHYFNHLLVSPDGERLILLHRWRFRPDSGKTFGTRMFTVGSDGRRPYVLDPYGKTSHFIWRDPKNVLAWAYHPSHGDKFYLYRDQTDTVDVVGPDVMTENGHCTYLPGNRWILNDTYPDRAKRQQHVYLFEISSGKRIPLADLYSPPEYTGEWRCDTHPRFSPDGKKVVVDSAHGGGRQLYLIDIAEIAV